MNCFYCKGDIKSGSTNHVVSLKDCIIIVKNVPCSECVQCGETFYDDHVAMELERIVEKVKNIVSDVAVFEYSKMAS